MRREVIRRSMSGGRSGEMNGIIRVRLCRLRRKRISGLLVSKSKAERIILLRGPAVRSKYPS